MLPFLHNLQGSTVAAYRIYVYGDESTYRTRLKYDVLYSSNYRMLLILSAILET